MKKSAPPSRHAFNQRARLGRGGMVDSGARGYRRHSLPWRGPRCPRRRGARRDGGGARGAPKTPRRRHQPLRSRPSSSRFGLGALGGALCEKMDREEWPPSSSPRSSDARARRPRRRRCRRRRTRKAPAVVDGDGVTAAGGSVCAEPPPQGAGTRRERPSWWWTNSNWRRDGRLYRARAAAHRLHEGGDGRVQITRRRGGRASSISRLPPPAAAVSSPRARGGRGARRRVRPRRHRRRRRREPERLLVRRRRGGATPELAAGLHPPRRRRTPAVSGASDDHAQRQNSR